MKAFELIVLLKDIKDKNGNLPIEIVVYDGEQVFKATDFRLLLDWGEKKIILEGAREDE